MTEISWRIIRGAAAVFAAILVCSIAAQAQKGKRPGGGNTNPYGAVASFVYCSPGDVACETANRARMDINAPYVDGQDGVDAQFHVGVSGDLTVATGSRFVTYDLSHVVNFGAPQPDWWYSNPVQNVSVHFNVGNAWAAKEQCGSAPTCDEHYVTRFNAGNWDMGRNTPTNRLQFNPNSIFTYINTPDTTSWVDVHYVKTADDEVWVITPLPNAGGYYLAGLESGLKRTVTASGQYNMPFTLVVRLK